MQVEGKPISTLSAVGYGEITEQNGFFKYEWVSSGTRLRLSADAQRLTLSQFKALVGNLSYQHPTIDASAYLASWKGLAQCAQFPVYAPLTTMPTNTVHTQIEGLNLVLGMPQAIFACAFITLPIYHTTKPGVGVLMTEFASYGSLEDQEPITLTGELSTAYYSIIGERHMIQVVVPTGTMIRLEAIVSEVSRETLLILAAKLELVRRGERLTTL